MKSLYLSSQFNRRQFLQKCLTAGLSLYTCLRVAPSLFGQKAEAQDIEYDCIVLGAGLAGISAARALQNQISHGPFPQNKFQKKLRILVLEGSHRLGGRVQTIKDYTGSPLELGAEYIHREQGSVPLWEEVNNFELKTTALKKIGHGYMYHPSFLSNVKELPHAATHWDTDLAKNLLNEIDAYRGPDISTYQWLEKNSSTYQGIGRDFAKMALIGHLPGSIHNISMNGFHSDKIAQQMKEPHENVVHSGNLSFVERMALGIDVRFNQVVDTISYEDGVKITTVDGASCKAKTAICTFSIGMLKSEEVTFQPALPKLKQEALKNIQMGPISKVILRFKKKFWMKKASMIHRPDEGRRAGRTYFHVYDDYMIEPGEEATEPNLPDSLDEFLASDELESASSKTDELSDLDKMIGVAKAEESSSDYPATLAALLLGDDAAKLENLSDDEVLRKICADLDEMFPEAGDCYKLLLRREDGSIRYQRKQWALDPFAKGGNSFLSLAQSKILAVENSRKILENPQDTPGLFWAGEGVSIDTQPASMHGAHVSGLRAAYHVRHFLENKKHIPAEQLAAMYKAWEKKNG